MFRIAEFDGDAKLLVASLAVRRVIYVSIGILLNISAATIPDVLITHLDTEEECRDWQALRSILTEALVFRDTVRPRMC